MALLPLAAAFADSAEAERQGGNAFSRDKAADLAAYLGNLAAELVAQHRIGLEPEPKLHAMEIGAADPAIMHLEQDLVRTGVRARKLPQFELVGALIQDGFHG